MVKRRRSKARGSRRGRHIAIGIVSGVAVVLVLGVFAAGPVSEAVREVVGASPEAPDAPRSVVVPPQSIAVSQPGGAPGDLAGLAGLADVAWANAIAQKTNISVRAIQAYAGVAIAKQIENPGCHLGWNTLAAIGSVESGNGTHGNSVLSPDGVVSPPIYGPALDGDGVNAIPDSDGGAIDGDATVDRAVGPMQLIPEAWRNWGTDASGDGVADPQNIDDATLATANYLCHSGDLGTDAGWKRGIASYNDATSYALKVSTAANLYAQAAASL